MFTLIFSWNNSFGLGPLDERVRKIDEKMINIEKLKSELNSNIKDDNSIENAHNKQVKEIFEQLDKNKDAQMKRDKYLEELMND